MKKVIASVLASAASVGVLFTAPTAQASTYYGAIVYQSNRGNVQSGVFSNYSSGTQMIVDIQNKWPDAGYITFSSGGCGAVVRYVNDINSGWATGTGSSMDAATASAMSAASGLGRKRLVRAACQ